MLQWLFKLLQKVVVVAEGDRGGVVKEEEEGMKLILTILLYL